MESIALKKFINKKNISAIILAAGEGKRFGYLKQLYRINEKPMLETVVEKVVPYFYETLLVLGYRAEKILREVFIPEDVRVLINRNYKEGMSTSLSLAVRHLSPYISHFAIFLSDMPYIKEMTIFHLLNSVKNKEREIIAPSYKGKRGFPVIFSRDFEKELRYIAGDRGARDVISKNKTHLSLIDVNDPGIIKDVDRREDI